MQQTELVCNNNIKTLVSKKVVYQKDQDIHVHVAVTSYLTSWHCGYLYCNQLVLPTNCGFITACNREFC